MSPTEAPPPSSEEPWNIPKPAVIPRATYFPLSMAFGVTLLLWGLVTSPVVLVVGLVIVTASLAGWIREMTA